MEDEQVVDEDENIIYLSPTYKSRKILTKMSYKEGLGWIYVRLNKYMMREFPQLRKDKTAIFNNIMIVPKSIGEIEFEISEIKEKGGPLPILLYFVKMRENYK